jgi:alkyl sulfatase BDS1-like metallo-beta-lactamase superfamily hydrolase
MVPAMPRGNSSPLDYAGILWLAAAAALAAPDRTPTPTTISILKEVETRIVTEKAKDLQVVVGVRTIDTKEDFTISLDRGKIQVVEGLPKTAVAVLSGRRQTILNIVRGTETLSGAIRRNLIDVRGNIDKVFELLDCCIRRAGASAR